MNTIEIKINPYKDINIASLDGRPLSLYSELNNYMKEPFLKWADKLLDAAEREINDDFNLVITAEKFETLLLADMQNDFDSCKSYETGVFQINNNVNDRLNMVCRLADKYNIEYNLIDYRIPFYSETTIPLDDKYCVATDINDAFIYITNDISFYKEIISKLESKIVVVISDKSIASSIGDMKYLWQIEDNRSGEIIESIIDRFAKIPLIVDLAKKINDKMSIMESKDKEELSLCTEVDMFISVDDINDIEVGKTTELSVKTIPQGNEMPQLRIQSSNSSIVEVNDLTLKALAPGTVNIEIYRTNENIPIDTKTVSTFADNMVKKIQLSVATTQMGISYTQKIEVTVFPEDAEDRKLIHFTSDNPEVLSVDDQGNIISKNAGKATITASSSRVNESIVIEVLPNISEISLSVKDLNLYVGETKPVMVSIEPKEVYDNSYEWTTSDKAVAVVDTMDDGTYIIRATGIGNCVLNCIAKEGECSAACTVNVDSTFKKREKASKLLGYEFACFIVGFVCIFMGLKIGLIAAAVGTLILGIFAIQKNKADTVWAIVMIIIIMYITYNNIL